VVVVVGRVYSSEIVEGYVVYEPLAYMPSVALLSHHREKSILRQHVIAFSHFLLLFQLSLVDNVV